MLLRIILSPFVFLYGLSLLVIGTIFPLTILVIMSFYGLLFELFKKFGLDISGIEPYIDDTDNNTLGHFLGLTIHIWGAFVIFYIYLKDGTIWTLD